VVTDQVKERIEFKSLFEEVSGLLGAIELGVDITLSKKHPGIAEVHGEGAVEIRSRIIDMLGDS
jgi:hypothetical protein